MAQNHFGMAAGPALSCAPVLGLGPLYCTWDKATAIYRAANYLILYSYAFVPLIFKQGM